MALAGQNTKTMRIFNIKDMRPNCRTRQGEISVPHNASSADLQALVRQQFAVEGDFVITTVDREVVNGNNIESLKSDQWLLILLDKNQPWDSLEIPTDFTPHHDVLIESGTNQYYDFNGRKALPFVFAELIDNSIQATCKNENSRDIEIRLYRSGTSYTSICVLDNGKGMTSEELTHWATLRESKFTKDRKELAHRLGHDRPVERLPRFLNSNISYFGVGGKQAAFTLGKSVTMITKNKDSQDVHQLTISKDKFEKKDQLSKAARFVELQKTRKPGMVGGQDRPMSPDLEHVIKDERDKRSFAHVFITNLREDNIKMLTESFAAWRQELARIYHYYIHGPDGNVEDKTNDQAGIKLVDITVTERRPSLSGRTDWKLRDFDDDYQSKLIKTSKSTFEFCIEVQDKNEPMATFEGLLRYHPYESTRETFPKEFDNSENDTSEDVRDVNQENDDENDKSARGNRPIFECYWNGRLIPETTIEDFSWCRPETKKSRRKEPTPMKAYNRVSGVLFTDAFEVNATKYKFLCDLESKLIPQNTLTTNVVVKRVRYGQTGRIDPKKDFEKWLYSCHMEFDKEILFRESKGPTKRTDLPPGDKRLWTAYGCIEWDGKTFKKGHRVMTKGKKTFVGKIKRFLLAGDHEGTVRTTGGEFELELEPSQLYAEVKIFHLIQLDRSADEGKIGKRFEEEEEKIPDSLHITWPHGPDIKDQVLKTGDLIGDMQVEVRSRGGQSLSRVPDSSSTFSPLKVELKVKHGRETVYTSEPCPWERKWHYYFKTIENATKKIGEYTIELRTVYFKDNRNGSKLRKDDTRHDRVGKHTLPVKQIGFSVEAGPAYHFKLEKTMTKPLRVDVPFDIHVLLMDYYNNPVLATDDLQPELRLKEYDMAIGDYKVNPTEDKIILKDIKVRAPVGKCTLIVKFATFDKKYRERCLPVDFQPGKPHKLVAPSPVNGISIQNREHIGVKIHVKDRAGNLVTNEDVPISCEFSGSNGLPVYRGTTGSTGEVTLTGQPIHIRDMSGIKRITAHCAIQGRKYCVPPLKIDIDVRPSNLPSQICVYVVDDHEERRQFQRGEELVCTVNEEIKLDFQILDECKRPVNMDIGLVKNLELTWGEKRVDDLLKGHLPTVKAKQRFDHISRIMPCRMKYLCGAETVLFNFKIRLQPGKPCKMTSENYLSAELGQPLAFTLTLMDQFDNKAENLHQDNVTISSDEGQIDHTSVKVYSVEAGCLRVENVFLTGFTTPRQAEVTIKYENLTSVVTVDVTAGPPYGLVANFNSNVALEVCNGSSLSERLIFHLVDEYGNHLNDVDDKVELKCYQDVKITPFLAQPNANGEFTFTNVTITGPFGLQNIWAETKSGNVESLQFQVHINPSSTRPDQISLAYDEMDSYEAGTTFPPFEVIIISEAGNPLEEINPGDVQLSMRKSEGQSPISYPSCKVRRQESDGEFFLSFSDIKVPIEAGTYFLSFALMVEASEPFCSSEISIVVRPGPLYSLMAKKALPLPCVSNASDFSRRVIAKEVTLHLEDRFGNKTGLSVSGTLDLTVEAEAHQSVAVPILEGDGTLQFLSGHAFISSIAIKEQSPGKNKGLYILTCRLRGTPYMNILPFQLKFIFCADFETQEMMKHLELERKKIEEKLTPMKRLIDSYAEKEQDLNASIQDEETEIARLKELIEEPVADEVDEVKQQVHSLEEKCDTLIQSARTCDIVKYQPHDEEILGKIGHLASVSDDNEARIVSRYLQSSMDCVVTMTTKKAMEIHKRTRGQQDVLPLDAICVQEWRGWDRVPPHVSYGFTSMGNPVYARRRLQFSHNVEQCKIGFEQLLGDTILIDTLEDAISYRNKVICHRPCPTILTRCGNRVLSNGMISGSQHRCPPDLAVFGQSPVPEVATLRRKIDLMRKAAERISRWQQFKEDLNEHREEMKSKDIEGMKREYEEGIRSLECIKNRLPSEKDTPQKRGRDELTGNAEFEPPEKIARTSE